jgi:hypothetical protein
VPSLGKGCVGCTGRLGCACRGLGHPECEEEGIGELTDQGTSGGRGNWQGGSRRVKKRTGDLRNHDGGRDHRSAEVPPTLC